VKRDTWLYPLTAALGALVWYLITSQTGKREAWDSELYFVYGIPAVCLVSLVAGFIEPRHAWRWGVMPLAGQFIWLLVTKGPGNLLPLGVIVFGIFSIPSVVTALIGGAIGRKRRAPGG
jgi:hypothetical protein